MMLNEEINMSILSKCSHYHQMHIIGYTGNDQSVS